MPEIYISTDIETDGPIPGDYSMLSLGSAMFSSLGQLVDTFQCNLKPLPGASQHPETMLWWEKHPEAWIKSQINQESPKLAMEGYHEWIRSCCNPGDKPVFVGYPASYDFCFVHWYFHHFIGSSPFGFQALDLKTYAMAALGREFKETYKSSMPKKWFVDLEEHTHGALQDALEQGKLFFRIREYLRNK